jgi:DNA gyrase subunit A
MINSSSNKTKLSSINIELHKELQTSFIDYALSVIISRALPDVRDGFKPSQRRIVVAMDKQGLVYGKAHRKSVKVVGEVMANYHPHGDSAIYQTMVGLEQSFSKRYALLDGQGNWGSIDGDSAAAMRYTEVRMSKICSELLTDLDKQTVAMTSNFDETLYEPTVLPTKIPNLLVNGSSGIAVGMATNIPPHNLSEVIDGIVAFIQNRDISDEELFSYVKGPDFPTGGVICGYSGIHKIYTQGRGSLLVRGIIEKEKEQLLVISEIPYQVIKADLVAKIAKLSKEKVIDGIAKVRDESNKKGIRVVLELKKDSCVDTITNLLYKHTSLQVSFHASLLALQNNKPYLFTLRSMIEAFVAHRKDVIYRRSLYEKEKALKKRHILLGLQKVLSNIDEGIRLIRSAKSTEEASSLLQEKMILSEEQAKAVLDLKLYKLTSLERQDIEHTLALLEASIESLTKLLASEELIDQAIIDESLKIKEVYGDQRRTKIERNFVEIGDPIDFIADEEVVITLTKTGYLKRVPLLTYDVQRRGGKGKKGMNSLDQADDVVQDIFLAKTHDELLFFTNFGRVYSSKVYLVPECSRLARGRAIINMLPHLQQGEKVIKLMCLRSMHNLFLVLVTKQGLIKKTDGKFFKNIRQTGIRAISLNEGDELVFCMITAGNNSIMLATKQGMAIRFYENEVRSTGRNSLGVRGIRLKKNDEIVGALVINESQSVLLVTENGFGKRVEVNKFRTIHRGGIGVRTIPTDKRNGQVVGLGTVSDECDLLLIDENGKVIRMSSGEIRSMGRQAKGVRLIKLDEGQKVACIGTLASEAQANPVSLEMTPSDIEEGKKPEDVVVESEALLEDDSDEDASEE